MRNLLIALVLFVGVGIIVGQHAIEFVDSWTAAPWAEDPESEERAIPSQVLASSSRGVPQEYYQFVDASGQVRFVTSLDQVPQAQRATAGRVVLDRPPPTAPGRASAWQEDAASSFEARVSAEAARASASRSRLPRTVAGRDIVLYVGPGCDDCRHVAEYLRQEGVNFTMKNIRAGNRNLTELTEITESAYVPTVILWRGRSPGMVVQGYRPDELYAIVLRAKGVS